MLEPPRRLHGEAIADHMAAMLDQARRHGIGAAAGRRAADGFTHRVHDAVLALMRAADPVWCMQHDVPGLLCIESVRVCAEHPVPGAALVAAGTVTATLEQRGAVIRDAVWGHGLHGEATQLARREAFVRVPLAGGPALLALAARDGVGLDGASTPALAFLGQALAATLERA